MKLGKKRRERFNKVYQLRVVSFSKVFWRHIFWPSSALRLVVIINVISFSSISIFNFAIQFWYTIQAWMAQLVVHRLGTTEVMCSNVWFALQSLYAVSLLSPSFPAGKHKSTYTNSVPTPPPSLHPSTNTRCVHTHRAKFKSLILDS